MAPRAAGAGRRFQLATLSGLKRAFSGPTSNFQLPVAGSWELEVELGSLKMNFEVQLASYNWELKLKLEAKSKGCAPRLSAFSHSNASALYPEL